MIFPTNGGHKGDIRCQSSTESLSADINDGLTDADRHHKSSSETVINGLNVFIVTWFTISISHDISQECEGNAAGLW